MERVKVLVKKMVFFGVLVGLIGASASFGVQVTDLGALSGGESWAYDISPQGTWIAGRSKLSSGARVACAWDASYSIYQIDSLGGEAWGYGANDSGIVVGRSYVGYYKRAFVWDSVNSTRELPMLPGGSVESGAKHVNNNTTIVGLSDSSAGVEHAVYWKPDGVGGWSVVDLQSSDTESWRRSSAEDISEDENLIIGCRYTGNVLPYAYFWRKENRSYVGHYMSSNVRLAYAHGCNDNWQAVGYGQVSIGGSYRYRALYWTGLETANSASEVTQIELGTLGGDESKAYDVNNNGLIVGTAQLADSSWHAFIWDSVNGMQDLNDFIDPNSGWILESANGINDSGWIVGYGTHNGTTRAFTLQIPEPATIGLICAGLMGLLRRKK